MQKRHMAGEMNTKHCKQVRQQARKTQIPPYGLNRRRRPEFRMPRRASCIIPNPQRTSLHAVTPRPPGNALVCSWCTLLLPAACSERIPAC